MKYTIERRKIQIERITVFRRGTQPVLLPEAQQMVRQADENDWIFADLVDEPEYTLKAKEILCSLCELCAERFRKVLTHPENVIEQPASIRTACPTHHSHGKVTRSFYAIQEQQFTVPTPAPKAKKRRNG